MKKILLFVLCLFSFAAISQERKFNGLVGGDGSYIVTDVFAFADTDQETITNQLCTIDWEDGNVANLSLTDTVTVAFTAPSYYPCELILFITHDTNTTVFPITWPNTVKWVGGSSINTTEGAGAIDLVKFIFTGTNYYELKKSLDIK